MRASPKSLKNLNAKWLFQFEAKRLRLDVVIIHAIKYLFYQIYDDDISHVTTPKINVLLLCGEQLENKEHGWKAVSKGYSKLGGFYY